MAYTSFLRKTLHVTSGFGLAQVWGGPIQTIQGRRYGFQIRLAKNTGTALVPKISLVVFAMQEALDGKTVEWLEKVSDTQYSGHD